MEESSAVTNDHHLKNCILNEVLKKIPIFDSYRNFCEAVGQDAMDYPDFEFWYYRFYHGQMNFDYDRNMDPVPKTIMDMPIRLMQKITEHLDPVERTYLRSMNESLKEVADSYPIIFENILIRASDDYMRLELNDKMFRCSKETNGCILITPFKEVKSQENFMEKRLKTLTSLFKLPNIQVNHFSLTLFNGSPTITEVLPGSFHAKSAELYAFDMDHIFPILSAMSPGVLESIHLKSIPMDDSDQMLRFFETEQFKQAKHVDLKWYYKVDDLMRFSHLKSFKCEVDFFEAVDFQRIRDIIPTFKQFESCELKRANNRRDFDIRTIALALVPMIPFGFLEGQDAMKYPDFEFWYYRFYHGEMDLDYDRSLDPEAKTIMDMPIRLMHKIVENLDPVERAYLRSMNKAIKEVADFFTTF
ncbi:hypothetical protein B9Z55_026898 [Caenorhabditis nigoni]|uniref:F-box domain-containing protein n=1 Tax=Caenorhabditis nigoni TaxID=1611254 RepID=A0A2G5SHX5_9PELO|nr:hypothetical protein B9Z55_026898 [Caenorhabditis nigoni]